MTSIYLFPWFMTLGYDIDFVLVTLKVGITKVSMTKKSENDTT